MSNTKKTDLILNWITTNDMGMITTWVRTLQETPITNYQVYSQLADEWINIQQAIKTKEMNGLEGFPYPVNDLLSTLSKVWRKVRKDYFDTQYIDEILTNPNHPLCDVLTTLKRGIHSFNDYEKMELRWNREILPFCLMARPDSSNLIKTTLGKFYTVARNHYAETVISDEIETNPQHPLYDLNQLVQDNEKIKNMNTLDLEVLMQQTERTISQLSGQHQKYLTPFYRKLFIKLKEIQYPIQTDIHRRWKVCINDIKQHPEWLTTNKLLNKFLSYEGEFTTETLEHFCNHLNETQEQRRKEMNAVEFEWIENEWVKHIRLCQKRLVDEKNNKFGKWLANTRQEKKLTLQELSSRTNISTSYLHKLEKYGRKSPSITTIRRIVNALDLPFNEVAELLGIEVDSTPIIQEVEVVKVNPDLLLSLNQEECVVGETKLNTQSRQSLSELLSFIYSKTFNPDTLQDSLKVIELVKGALA